MYICVYLCVCIYLHVAHRYRLHCGDSQRRREAGGSWTVGEGEIRGDGRRLDFGCEYAMECAGDVFLSCALETCMVLVTNVSPINPTKNKNK